MHTRFPPNSDADFISKAAMGTGERVMNKKGAQRRYAAKMAVGDSESEVFTCKYDPSDKYLAAGFGDGAIRIYNT